MQVFTNKESLGALTKTGNTTVQLSSSTITLGAKQYDSGNLVCDLSTSGVGGLDTGSIAANTLYMVYAVVSGGSSILIASTRVNSLGPLGYSVYKLVGAFYTNAVSTIESTTPIKGAPLAKRSESQIIRYGGYTSKDGSNFIKFGTRQYNTSSNNLDESLMFSDDNTTQTRITAIKECYFDVSSAYHATTTANSININRYNSLGVLQEGNNNEQNTGYHTTTVSTTFQMDVGDYVLIYANKVPGAPSTENIWLQVLATSAYRIALSDNVPLEDL